MIPRTAFKIVKSLEDLYEIDETKYRRFNSGNTAFVVIGQKDTGEIGPMNWLDKLMPNMMSNIANNVDGKSRIDYALMMGAEAVHYIIGTYGDQNANKQFLKWNPLFVPEFLNKSPAKMEPEKLTSLVKSAATAYGADLVGIAELDHRWVYDKNIYKPFIFDGIGHPTETDEAFVIPSSINRAVVMVIAMNRDWVLQSPSVANHTAADFGYSKMAALSLSVAEFIRALGYNAIPCMNDTALSIPLAISAGLGQLGRLGLMITPEYGPCIRICKVLTDMPLNTDKPIDYGQTSFCSQCLLCARACPAGAISFEDRTMIEPNESNNPGVRKWYIDAQKCLRFWQANGTACSNCIAACPFTVEFSSEQCLRCERCIAPQCPLQLVAAERLKHGYIEDKRREEKGQEAWERYLEVKYFSGR